MNSPAEVSIRDRSVQDIHLEKAFTYLIDTNLKVFAESIQVLSKISEQILMQPSANSIIMTAYNSTKSAYGKITMSNNFFTHAEGPLDDAQQNDAPDGDHVCRISTRSALHIFKNVASKSLAIPAFDSCQLELDPRADYAIIHLKQKFGGIQRAFILPMKEHTTSCENIFTERDRLKNKITSQPKMLLNQFAGLDCREVKLVVSATQFSAHRYIIREELSKVRKTEVTIPVDHFETYHIHLNSQIVISLRELRSVLHFADSCGMIVSLHFDRPGRPVIVAVDDTVEFKAEFVLATMDEGDPLTLAQQLVSTQTPQTQQKTPTARQQMQKQSRIMQETPPPPFQQKQLGAKQRIAMHQQPSVSDESENQSPRCSASFY